MVQLALPREQRNGKNHITPNPGAQPGAIKGKSPALKGLMFA